jgi:hypothetical protein
VPTSVRIGQGFDLSVGRTRLVVPTTPDHFAVSHQYGSDQGIGRRLSVGPFRKLQRLGHESLVEGHAATG